MDTEFFEELQLPANQLITKDILNEYRKIKNNNLFILIKRNGSIIADTDDFSNEFMRDFKRRKSMKRLAGLRLLILRKKSLKFNLGNILLRYRFDNILVVESKDKFKLFLPKIKAGQLTSWRIKEFESSEGVINYDFQFLIEAAENKLAKVDTYQVANNYRDLGIIVTPFSKEIEEMKNLAKTAGVEIKDIVVQKIDSINSAYYIGRGKVREIKEKIELRQANMIIFADELSPVQHSNLENALEVKVVDRTQLILDIFAQHANTKEGKLQVELAQLEYLLPRLTGKGNELSRLGAGIATRGPGETKLEIDRRRIRERIHKLKEELKKIKANRKEQRKRRDDPIVALVGYTNAGKSTLLNSLTGAEVKVENKLFATLDSTLCQVKLESIGRDVIFTDTVGFIRRLPHQLIAAFKSTLEEVQKADILLHVIDCGAEKIEERMKVVYQVLEELGVIDKELITVFNKRDLISESKVKLLEKEYPDSIIISAVKSKGINKLLHKISEIIKKKMEIIALELDYDNANLLDQLHQKGKVLAEKYTKSGIEVTALIPEYLAQKLDDYRP